MIEKLNPIRGVKIAGVGFDVPELAVTNDKLIDDYHLDSSDKKIKELCGNEIRYIRNNKTESNAGMATEAARMALEAAGIQPPYSGIDRIIVATSTPDIILPCTAVSVGKRLGIRPGTCGTFDLNAACAGFEYALNIAYKDFLPGDVKQSLVIGVDSLTTIVNLYDRHTAILFGDGAGAVVLEKTEDEEHKDSGLLAWHEQTDPSLHKGSDDSLFDILKCEHGEKLHMNGPKVYEKAIEMVVSNCRTLLEKADLDMDQVDIFIPHQANKRITYRVANKLGIPDEKVVSVIHKYANTSAASVPIALYEAIKGDRIKPGDIGLLVGFGAGMSVASSLIKF